MHSLADLIAYENKGYEIYLGDLFDKPYTLTVFLRKSGMPDVRLDFFDEEAQKVANHIKK